MTIYVENIGSRSRGEIFEWGPDDALLYALGVGAGIEDLAFTTENTRGVSLTALPTMAVVLANHRSQNRGLELGDFELKQILHAGQSVTMYQTLQPSGRGYIEAGMTAVYDKGKHAIIETTSTLVDAETDLPIADMVMQMMIRGEGGFGGNPGPRDAWEAPLREPDEVVKLQTSPNQALLYRLNGDRNPLHSDPGMAQAIGFPGPILHGLCTWGFTARALLKSAGGGDVDAFGSFAARFISPVSPGDRLDVQIWHEDGCSLFRTCVEDRVVLDRGEYVRRSDA